MYTTFDTSSFKKTVFLGGLDIHPERQTNGHSSKKNNKYQMLYAYGCTS